MVSCQRGEEQGNNLTKPHPFCLALDFPFLTKNKRCRDELYVINQNFETTEQSKANQFNSPGEVFFSKEKLAASGGIRTHDTLLSRPSALPT